MMACASCSERFTAGYKFSGGSTAKAMDMLEKNSGYLGIFSDEARNFFPSTMTAHSQVNESQFLKPEALLPFRTGAGIERQLLKNSQTIDRTQVGMCFMSQFPAARAFLVQIIKNLSIGWAQGFIFVFDEDKKLLYEDEGDDTAITETLVEVLEIVARAYGPKSDWSSSNWTIHLAEDCVPK